MFSIFLSCIVCGLLFIPDLLKFTWSFDRPLLKKMLLYSLPLMVASLPGIVNDFLDRILFRFFDTNSAVWQSSLGVFQAAVKLSVIMNLFIQMFRYAAEPFFFQRAKEKDSKQQYAQVMEWFTAFCGLIFLGVILYIDVISLILGRDFREGVGVVPIMLFSYMLLGMLFNVSMWYKLSGKTSMAIYITLAGLVVTLIVNVIFMAMYSYWASAFGHLASYLVMFIVSAVLGAKYYPIPYRWGKIIGSIVLMGVAYLLSLGADQLWFHDFVLENASAGAIVAKFAVHTALILAYIAACWFLLRRPAKTKTVAA